jgi:hypothetical protein
MFILFALGIACLGCGGDGSYRVSGKVTFKGQAVPSGKIYFMPDASKRNTGPTGFADIKDGHYDTSMRNCRGSVSGPIIIAVEGIDPNAPPDKPKKGEEVSAEATGKLLFQRYEIKFEMPQASTVKDIEVPAEASKGPLAPKPPPGTIVP